MENRIIKRHEIQQEIYSLEREIENAQKELKIPKEPNGLNKYDKDGNLIVAYTTQIEIDYAKNRFKLENKISSNKKKIESLKKELKSI